MVSQPDKRHEWVFLFDVLDGNPNGDPDAGNLPRVDPQTNHGLVTDVALKRKIRDYAALVLNQPLFIQSQHALNTLILRAFRDIGVEPASTELSEQELEDEDLVARLQSLEEAGFALDGAQLTYTGEDTKLADIRKRLSDDLDPEQSALKRKLDTIARRLADAAKGGKSVNLDLRNAARKNMAQKYFDIRMFGAVLSTGLNAGQVRGPVQLTFARSADPVLDYDLGISRVAITKESDRKRKATELGRKASLPYGLYRSSGFFNPFLARTYEQGGTGVSSDDMNYLWEALANLFEFDRSAARVQMAVQGLFVFSHNSDKGNAPSHKLLKLVEVQKKDGIEAPRSVEDYDIQAPPDGPLESFPGVSLTRLV
jgi:CRISPR-associated protein Csd2